MPRPWFTVPRPSLATARVPNPFSGAPMCGMLALLLLAGCARIPAEPVAERGTLSGRARLEGVFTDQGSITLRLEGQGGGYTALTDAKGYFTFRDVPRGTYTLTARRERYFPVTLQGVTVSADSSLSPFSLRNHRELVALSGHYDASRRQDAQDPESGQAIPVTSPFLTNLTLSPDGTRLGFVQAGAIRSVRLDGADLRTEVPLPPQMHADWVDWGQRGFLLRARTPGASPSVSVLSPRGFETLVPAGDALFSPVWSPDEQQVAYVRYEASTKSPQLMAIPAAGGSPMRLMDLLDRLNLRGIWDGTYGLMFSPLEWRPEGLMFHAPMTCNLERSGFTLGKDGIYVLRNVANPQAEGALHKAHFYSYYAHAFSHDGKRLIYGYGPQIRAKELDDPVVTAPGVNVGNHSDEVFESLIPSPDGERVFYLTPTGIEEMTLLTGS